MTLRKRLGAALASLFAMSSLCAPGQAAPLVGSRALPSRVVANLYRLGSHSDSVFLVTTPEGHFLINSGSSDASDAEVRPQTLRAQMEALGFRLGDVKVLLTNCPSLWGLSMFPIQQPILPLPSIRQKLFRSPLRQTGVVNGMCESNFIRFNTTRLQVN